MGHALLTDVYELTMAASYLRREMLDRATFSLFIRELPAARGFLVAAGLEDCLAYLESLRFGDDDLAWLSGQGFDDASVERFSRLQFTGDVWAVPEGRVVLAGEPLLEVTAPLPEAQLVETFLLNRVTFQTMVASKAARCRLAAPDLALVDFSLRRTSGIDASLSVARAAVIAGFTATSNVEAARALGVPASGTMAHSYVEAFDTEADAFAAFCEDSPGPYTFLVDTYDTVEGVATAARVIAERHPAGKLAVRLDSGDLSALAFEARRILDDAGLPEVGIFVSGGLDEYRLEDLVASGAPVDGAGVGTRLGVSADAPLLDSAYKLVELGGRSRVKRSEGKETLPGAKQVWRRAAQADVLGLRHEEGPPDADALLVPVMAGGRRTGPTEPLEVAQTRLDRDLAWLPAQSRRVRRPVAPAVDVSRRLGELAAQLGVPPSARPARMDGP